MLIKLFSKGNESAEAVIILHDGKTDIQTEDGGLRNRLIEICAKPITRGRAVMLKDGFVGYEEIQLMPEQEEFFKEAAYLFREMNYDVRIEEEQKNAILALDFDGTLWDSVQECYLASVKAFNILGWPLPDVTNSEERFRRGRFFPATGKDFYTLLNWIKDHPDRDPVTMTAEEEAALRQESARNPKAEQFEKVFYDVRSSWMKNDFKGWACVQGPYPGVIDQVRTLEKRFSKIVIATTKDAASAQALLATQGLSFEIIGKERTVDKMKQIIYLSKTYKKPFDEILFVDDLLYQVKAVKSLGAKVALAGWGYNSARQKEEAKRLQIPILEPAAFAGALLRMFE